MNKIRKIPPVCLFFALARLLTGTLQFSKEYIGTALINKEGEEYEVFRNIQINDHRLILGKYVFVVSFKFASLSHRENKLASLIPMLLIAGFPGFVQKMYAVNYENGYWMGMYEWKSRQHLEAYKKSFVFRMMKKRAKKGTITSCEIRNSGLFEGINSNELLMEI